MADVLDHRDRLAADADLSAGRVDQSKDRPARGPSYRIEVRLFTTKVEYCRAERIGFMAIDLPQLRGLISAQVSLPAVSLPGRFGSLLTAKSLPARPRREADRKLLICRRIQHWNRHIFDPESIFLPAFAALQGCWRLSAGTHLARKTRAPRSHRYRCGLCEGRGLNFAQVAGDVVAGHDLAHFRLLLGAAVEGAGAAGVEAAARGRVDRARHVAL